MNFRSGNQIREDFLRFFETKGHRRVHSSSLAPHNDPTLLFTNAGMNQFKDVFLGLEKRSYERAASSQKCVRAGGKHNDLENVGFTRRHHTFFEMLGNFSFGDYFKREAIQYAWELLTSPEWFGIDPARLYVTIFEGDPTVPRDTEAERLWVEVGVPADRIFPMSAKDNFWQMGDTGPCGPCSEIFYDLGLAASEHTDAGGEPRDLPFGEDDQRYVEIWNLVFMQFDRAADGALTPLPKPSIDTGMGLERISAVLQGRLSNYETDLFTPLIARAAELCGSTTMTAAEASIRATDEAASLRIIADHARAATFLISDGVLPANEGRGYVLRKILRRAIRHGRQLGQENPFMEKMVFAVRDEMKVAYPELSDTADLVSKTVRAEEEQFSRVLEAASRRFDELMDHSAETEHPSAPKGIVEGEKAFKIYETFGLPLDFMLDAARDRGLKFDQLGFERSMREEQSRARKSWTGTEYKSTAKPFYDGLPKTQFEGYGALRVDGARVLALVRDGVGAQQLAAGEAGEVVLDSTSFYADSGGQVGDVGQMLAADHQTVLADVSGCSKPVSGVFAHRVVVRAPIAVGDVVDTVVDGEVRRSTMRNHTGTHLLHAALRDVLGPQVKQAGSLVDRSRLRFDFSHFGTIAEEELRQVEDLVNKEVLANAKVETLVDVPIDVAVHELGATALFGEKYGDRVRVVQIGGSHGFSTELCGGTHVSATGEIGLIKVVGESSVSSGVRRIEALSGAGALREFQQSFGVARAVGQMVGIAGATRSDESSSAMQNDLAGALRAKLAAGEDELKRLRRELEQVRVKEASASAAEYAQTAVDVRGVKLLSRRISASGSAVEVKSQMRTLTDELRSKLASGVVVLGSVTEGRVSLIVGVTKDLTGRIQAGKVVSELAAMVGGRGGGRPDIAEAGGGDPDTLDSALAKAPEVVEKLLS